MRDASEVMAEMAAAVTGHRFVDLRLGTRVVGSSGSAGGFRVSLEKGGERQTVEAGAIVVATGFEHFDPGRETQLYGYYEFDDVITLSDAEAMLKEKRFVRPSDGKVPERVCFIQCVGSRDRQIGNEYCSKVCCGIASKQAIEVRQQVPGCRVFIFYIDMRMYGYWENEIYWPAQEKYKVNYVKGVATEVLKKGDRLLVRGEDTTMNRPFEIPMDVVVLSVGMEPSKGTREVAKLLGLAQNKYGFIETPPGSLDTVTTSVPGIFVAGAAAGPKDLDDTMGMAGAAALKAAGLVRRMAQAAAVGA
jgi:heterodisulfide reductase subunit A